MGSGGIGYSDRRQQPRPSGSSPLFPPLAASPNLVPAATPSQPPNPVIPGNLSGQTAPVGGVQFNQPFFVPSPQPQPLKGQLSVSTFYYHYKITTSQTKTDMSVSIQAQQGLEWSILWYDH